MARAADDGGGIFKPMSKRCCTDIFCLLLFFVYLIAMIVIGIFSLIVRAHPRPWGRPPPPPARACAVFL